jgi:hypothetical protein
MREGYGILRKNDVDVFLGYWVNDKMHGCGHLKNQNNNEGRSATTPIDWKDLESLGNGWISY